ncbi:MAG: hypothetical protein UZ07_CHB004001797 [Chlorobi bacterium OLB7]|nr:MAG: hypothetical protein UZ07_CHB004001797 [Chlorobi bacterium OLB7]
MELGCWKKEASPPVWPQGRGAKAKKALKKSLRFFQALLLVATIVLRRTPFAAKIVSDNRMCGKILCGGNMLWEGGFSFHHLQQWQGHDPVFWESCPLVIWLGGNISIYRLGSCMDSTATNWPPLYRPSVGPFSRFRTPRGHTAAHIPQPTHEARMMFWPRWA